MIFKYSNLNNYVSSLTLPRNSYDIHIETREEGCFVFFSYSVYKNAHRDFEFEEQAKRFVSGETIYYQLPPKKRISIAEDATKGKQFEEWTERLTNVLTLENPLKVYHFGAGKNIKKVAAVETCFYTNFPKSLNKINEGGCFELILPIGTKLNEFGSDEIRVTPETSWECFNLKTGYLPELK